MKLSFSISSKSSSSRPPTSNPPDSFSGSDRIEDVAAKPQFVTVFDPSVKLSSDKKLAIPPLPNTGIWSNIPLPTTEDDASRESRFILDTSVNGSSDPGTKTYGLVLRAKKSLTPEAEEVHVPNKQEDPAKRWFQEDAKGLPDAQPSDISVEEFAAGIIAGYGLHEGKPIGRNCKVAAKVFENKRWVGTSGLGYDPKAPAVGKKRQKEEKTAGFKSVGEKNADNIGKYERKSESKEREKRNKDRRQDEGSRELKRDKKNVIPIDDKSPSRWLRNHIRVKIVSKKFGEGKLYLKKGEVVGVVGPTTCDIRIDGSKELVRGVDQEILETALPKCGGQVLVLYGKHKGVFGSLVEKDSEKETGLVRDANSHDLINVLLDQIAEYVGDPSTLGY